MPIDDHPEGDSVQDQLIHDYLENEATADQERRFRHLLGQPSFSRRVADFAIELGHLYALAHQGVLAHSLTQSARRSRRVTLIASIAASVVAAFGVAWITGAMSSSSSVHPSPSPNVRSGLEAPPKIIQSISRPIAQLEHVVGSVIRAASFDADGGEFVSADSKIHSGEVLRTIGPESFAVVQFADSSVVAMAGNSELKCEFDGSRRRVVVSEADLMAQVTSLSDAAPIVFKTSLTEAVTFGTKLSLYADVDTTEVTVQEGEVHMHRLSDGVTANVRGGETLVGSVVSDWIPTPLAPVSSVWEEDFDNGLPRRWRAGRLVDDSLPSGSFGAVRAVSRRGQQGDPGGPFRIASAREWARGLFRVEEDTHLNFTYKLKFRGGLHVRLNTHETPWYPGPATTYEFRSWQLRGATRTRWRTVSIPLQNFGRIERGRGITTPGEQPVPGSLAIMVSWASPGRDSGLILDRVWVTRGSPEGVEVLERLD